MFQIIVFETNQQKVAEERALLWNTRNRDSRTSMFRAGLNPSTGRYTVWKVMKPAARSR